MALEAATYISDLVATNPAGSDAKSSGDDHIRLVKSALKTTFPAVTGAVTVSHAQINAIPGLATTASPTFTGTPAAPTPSGSDNSTKLATTAFVQTAVAGVAALGSAPVLAVDATMNPALNVGKHIICTNASAVTATLDASPSDGGICWLTVGNGRTDNVIARNGKTIMGLAQDLTVDRAYVTVQLRYSSSLGDWRIL